MYAREVDGQELTFGVSGKLIMNALVMFDRQTDSLWSQFLGQAVRGPLSGTKLTFLPAELTTWKAWKAMHPDTLVLDKRIGRSIGSRDPYTSYYRSGSAGVLGETNRDDRLPRKEFVVGLATDAFQQAYAFRYLNDVPVVNDTFDGRSIVVTFDQESAAAAVFDRSVGDRTLTLEPTGERTPGGESLMRDLETGSTWGISSGEALTGPLVGERLERLPSLVSFWFAWTDFYPGTELYMS